VWKCSAEHPCWVDLRGKTTFDWPRWSMFAMIRTSLEYFTTWIIGAITALYVLTLALG
jgi:hypothetical protein